MNPGTFRRCLQLLLALVALMLGGQALGQTGRTFDHLSTGFPLAGAHQTVRCESCHQNGVLRGTPRDCASCHVAGQRLARGNVVMGGNHLSTTQACDACHNTRSFASIRFDHATVAGTACASCHNGQKAPGRSATHLPYQQVAAAATAGCESCHKSTTSWSGARFHSHFSPTTGCATCHGGGVAGLTSKPSTPVHAGVTACESCHASGTWAGAKVDHSSFNASTPCAQCHNGSAATARPASHMPTGSLACGSCHGTTGWKPTRWNHTQMAVSGQCASCHTGGYPPADGKPANHVPYASVAATASANCDSCHKSGFATWAPARVHTNVSISTSCASCHTGAFPPAVGKPSSAIHATVTGNCESCHKSTSTWSSAKVDHSTFNASTNCAQCHNGTSATGKSATHIPTGTAGCFSCHSTTGWTPTKWTHTQVPVTAQCASCHTGGYPPADGKPANHIPYASVAATASANCDSCHKSGFATWAPARVHANVSISSSCASCHTGAFPPAVGKPATAIHATVTGNCESCHKSTSTWSSAKVDHSSFNASTNCAQCHNGSTATGKSATHIPTGTAGCFSCHGTTGWTPTKWTHTQVPVTAQCASCHTGGYPPADGKPATHVPYASVAATASANCDSCHKSGFAAWAPARVHTNVSISSSCASCHTGAFPPAVGKPSSAIHATVTGNCESCHKSTSTWSSAKVDHSTFNASTNCSQCHNGSAATGKSGTHIPTGTAGCFSCHSTTGWTPTKWTHTQVPVTAQCASCHTGGYPPADGKPTNHIPYAAVAATAAANCDSCHKGSTTTWANGRLHANVSISTGCATCHNGSYLAAVGKPATAIHATVTGNCESCHKSTSTWSSAKVDHSTFNASTNCAQCHNGTSATGKSATHIPTGTAGCFSCHGTTGWTPTKWTHTQVPVTAQCASCHTGGYPPADGKPANHIPYASVAATASANCDGCHKGSTTTWANGRLHANASITTGCATCHTGSYLAAVGKPSNPIHATVTGNCESCHKTTTSWKATYTHGAANAVGTGTCDTCHNGSAATGKPATHIPVPAGAARCDSCHRSQASFKTSVTMNHSVVATATCKSCHNGSYLSAGAQGALAKPANHIPEVQLLNGAAMDCNACHTSTTSWGPQRMNHNGSQGNGAGWCKACHQSGTSYLGSMEKKSLTHERSTGVTDCSQSGCHRPLGSKGSAYTKWD